MASVRLENVTKHFGTSVAVAGIDLEIEDGTYCVLVGPSGCGKSTTLRLIAGLDEPTSGTIAIDGRRVEDLPPHRRDVAFVFQGYALYPHLSVADNLAFGLRRRREHGSRARALVSPDYRTRHRSESEAIAARVRDVAEQLELTELLARKPFELSGGQQQRVALGRALVRDPKVFLLDEPLSNLDARLRSRTRDELVRLQRRVRGTFVHVTHDQEEALALADRIVVMAEGAVQQNGTPAQIHARPANRFVASFVGQPAMRFVAGRVERDGDGAQRCSFEGGGLRVRLGAPAVPAAAAVLGVRPSDLELAAFGTSQPAGGGATDIGTARLVEVHDFGDHLDLELATAGDARLAVRTTRRALAAAELDGAPGGEVLLRAAPDALHLFEPGEFGARLGGGADERPAT
ncbi:sn-glycerol-3-phosphate import ATP-binding protein UgpC [Planctomycetes bacterium Pla163]|uniref:sn-glycerol-3-phosphate import ATP-binding protein UgpC n=1 Tax=Rohdeia mirabilis TaxID=2528008 RepID=A0A518CY40_9BACT|nr:sn-glycerol-3-phosphate import ATP-binding protein UgpC [Planctomycetes bacterium Pla163]